MPAADRSALRVPALPSELVEVPELGGQVEVRGLLLSQRLALFAGLRGDGTADAAFLHIPQLLALCVVCIEDGRPAFTAEQWEQFGAAHMDVALRLFDVAQKLSGLKVEDEKKS